MKLSPRQKQIYDNLLSLAQKNDAFYFVDQEIENVKFRIFLYRLASYTDFLEPDALESRGITFEIDADGNPVRLACRPFKKFFNLGENPFTMNLDLSADNIESITDKADGSLISSYMDDVTHKVMLKTKGSLHSEQAKAAMKLLYDPKNIELFRVVQLYTLQDFTVNMEYVSQEHRIVLGYDEPKLIVLGVINNNDGSLMDTVDVQRIFPSRFVIDNYIDEAEEVGVDKYLSDIKGRTGIEGVVVRLLDGTMVKIKADAYVALHHCKDSVNAPRRLFEAVVNESADDLRAMFATDIYVVNKIDEMQQKVTAIRHEMISSVEGFYEENKNLARKDYAILGKEKLDSKYFPLAMNKFIGRENDYKAWLCKNYKQFGIRDEEVVEE
jgi:RNA ligase